MAAAPLAVSVGALAPGPLAQGDLVRLFLLLATMLLVGKVASELFDRVGQPAVLGDLLAGALLGIGALHLIPTAPSDALYGVIQVLAEIGVVLLLFEIGLETDLRQFVRVGPGAAAVAVVGMVLPFALGILLWASPVRFANGVIEGPLATGMFLGAALTATSVGITARVLAELGSLRTREAQLILGAAVLDDVLGLVLLGLVSTLAAGETIGLGHVARALGVAAGFLATALGVGVLLVPSVFRLVGRMRVRGVLLASAFAFALLVAALAQLAGSAMIIGAFAAGIVLAGTDQYPAIERRLKPVADIFSPIFFLSVGAQLDVGVFNPLVAANRPVLLVGLVVTVVAAVGKFAAGWAAPWLAYNRTAVGAGMLPRGEVGLIFANLGLESGVLSRELFSAIMIMVIGTTFLAPALLKACIRRGGMAPLDAGQQPPMHPPETEAA
jgi:Kef-type K+ transport system membrane component KefB